MSFNSDILLISGNSILSFTNNGTINIGKSGQTVNMYGNTITINTTNLNVNDKLITINKGGGASSANGAGIEFEENSTKTSYLKISSDRNNLIYKAPVGNEQTIGNPAALSFATIFSNSPFSTSTRTVLGTFNLSNRSTCLFTYSGSSYGTNDTFTLSITGASGIAGTTFSALNTGKNTTTRQASPMGFETITLVPDTYTVTITSSQTTDSTLDFGSCSVYYVNI